MKKRTFIGGASVAALTAIGGALFFKDSNLEGAIYLDESDISFLKFVKLNGILNNSSKGPYISKEISSTLGKSYHHDEFVNVNGFLLPSTWYR